jgi:hypothetical protein
VTLLTAGRKLEPYNSRVRQFSFVLVSNRREPSLIGLICLRKVGGWAMPCKLCKSHNQTLFPSEICIHFPDGLEALGKESVLVFPQLLICLNCGFTECSVPEAELRRLAEGSAKNTA